MSKIPTRLIVARTAIGGVMAVPPVAANAQEKAGPRNGRMWNNGPATKTSFPRAARKSRMRTTLAEDVASHQAKVLESLSDVMPS